MLRKARAGHVTGGRVFGYDNVDVLGADGNARTSSGVINDAEAAVVRRIFELCAAGTGYSAIAKRLNAEARRRRGRSRGARRLGAVVGPRGPAPRALPRRDRLEPDRGSGISWGATTTAAAAGRPNGCDVPAPELRIVSEALWHAAHARLSRHAGVTCGVQAAVRRPASARSTRSTCCRLRAVCGAAAARMRGRARRQHGAAARTSTAASRITSAGRRLRATALAADATQSMRAVLDALERRRAPAARSSMAIVDGVLEQLPPVRRRRAHERLRTRPSCRPSTERSTGSTDAIAAGRRDVPSLLEALQARQERTRRAAAHAIAAARSAARPSVSRSRRDGSRDSSPTGGRC